MQQPINPLREVLSDDRIEGYRRAETDTDIDLLTRYFWNAALSETLYPLLQNLEVPLRNRMFLAIAQLWGPTWLTDMPSALKRSAQDERDHAIPRLQAQRKQATTGRIISGLSFDFWTPLLDLSYDQVF